MAPLSGLHLAVVVALGSVPCSAMRVTEFTSAGPPKLCDPTIVRSVCARLNTWSVFIKNKDADLTSVHAIELAHQLSLARPSVVAFFEAAGLTNVELSAEARSLGAWAVDCQELCEKTVAMIPEHHRPPTSDVACYRQEGLEQPVCDLDVSDNSLSLQFPDHSEKVAATLLHEVDEPTLPNETQKLMALEDVEAASVPPRVVRTSIANLFRIFPLTRVGLSAENDTFSFIEIDEEAGDVEEQLRHKQARAAQDNACASSVVGSVARAGWHPFGDDCKCPAGSLIGGSSADCATQSSGLRKFSSSNLAGKGCTCRAVTLSPDSCADADSTCSRRTGSCHLPEVQDRCPVSCGVDCAELPALAGFARDATEVAVKAQAYVAKAIARLNGKTVPSTMDRWFGSHDAQTRSSVLRVLNGVNQMLMNVEYIYPGDQCKGNTYAYVYPASPYNKNGRGQYIVHLCPYYMKVDLGEKIETLTHEGSHHEPMYTKDECLDGSACEKKAYGREACKTLAKKFPGRALNNADSFCYFINDAAECTRNC